MSELSRFFRHALAPFVMWLVATGRLPEYMQDDVLEAAVLGLSLFVPLVLSHLRDGRK